MPPSSIDERLAAGEIVPAGALIYTDAMTMASEEHMMEQLLGKLSLAQEACAFKDVLWRVIP